ncbi:hypothetical protein HELRODRAFT_171647 [Helobdella robusta]|uniref:Uncharacterized protein n=1 Tax=Helobdella robusta TaxID=6412 RepID=T1F4I5_HELRO|nr:hypothetical protein HELRODRAFT_171647 [Helobdella robusta]ESO05286.1 hypothetical protein HELRODRAFT_171647 [Helobdella robusta]
MWNYWLPFRGSPKYEIRSRPTDAGTFDIILDFQPTPVPRVASAREQDMEIYEKRKGHGVTRRAAETNSQLKGQLGRRFPFPPILADRSVGFYPINRSKVEKYF